MIVPAIEKSEPLAFAPFYFLQRAPSTTLFPPRVEETLTLVGKGKMTANLDKCIEKLLNCEILSENQIKQLCHSLKQYLLTTSNVCYIHTPVTVVGDIHGFFFLLIN